MDSNEQNNQLFDPDLVRVSAQDILAELMVLEKDLSLLDQLWDTRSYE